MRSLSVNQYVGPPSKTRIDRSRQPITVGSVLSHVAIVCRELGIPFVAGVDDIDALDQRRGVLDGWSGQVTVEAHAR